MHHDRLLLAVIGVAGLFAFYFPSSLDGEISRPLAIASIAGTAALLAGMLWLTHARASAAQIAVSASIMAVPALFTITSPFEAYSPGVVIIYLGLALLCALDLRHVDGHLLRPLQWLLSIVSLAWGYALAFDVKATDDVTVAWYSAFYPELVSNMVVLLDKPVLSFATHSMAGFMLYLLFYLHYRAWRAGRGDLELAAALGFVGLLFLLRSTTGFAFGVLAAAELVMAVAVVWPRYLATTLLVLVFGGAVAFLGLGVDVPAMLQSVSAVVVGDRISGLFARYAAEGLLSGNLAFMSRSPLTPIGFSATESLYLGDSGLVLNTLRGSVLLLAAVYGAFWLFLRTNLDRARIAAWLWACVVLFELGFTPMQYFRFVAFVPLFVVLLNVVDAPPAVASPSEWD